MDIRETKLKNKSMYYYFNDEITTESVNSLVEILQGFDNNEKINLWFSTNGGNTDAMEFLIHYFNSIAQNLEITITQTLCSSGTMILEDFKGKINIYDLDFCLFHVADRETYNFRNNSSKNKKEIIKQDKLYNLNSAEKIKKRGLLTDKQIKDFLNGKDVYVYQEQIKTWKL